MKIKFIILISSIFILCACSFDYNLTINTDNSSNEELTIHNYNKYYNSNDAVDVIKSSFGKKENISYNFINNDVLIKRNNDSFFNLDNDLNMLNYFGSLNIDDNKISFIPDYDKCIFLFSDGDEYIMNETLTINVRVPFKIKETNADKVTNDTLTWIYSVNDCNKVSEIVYDNSESNTFNIIFGLFLLLILIAVIIYRKKTRY